MSKVADVTQYITKTLSGERVLIEQLLPYDILIWRVSYAACIEIADAVYEFSASLLAGERPDIAVPRRLGLFKDKATKRWMSRDLLLRLANVGSDDVDCVCDDPYVPPPKHDADGIRDIMQRDGIGRRAAQIRVKKQWDALTRQADLFIGGEAA